MVKTRKPDVDAARLAEIREQMAVAALRWESQGYPGLADDCRRFAAAAEKKSEQLQAEE